MIMCLLALATASFHVNVIGINYDDPKPIILTTDDRTIVLALTDQGSGNVSYELVGLEQRDDTLIATVKKHSPPINTMDFVSWVMLLEIDKPIYFSKVTLVLC